MKPLEEIEIGNEISGKPKREYLGKRGSEEYRKNMSNLIKQRIKEGCNHYYFPKGLGKGKKRSKETKRSSYDIDNVAIRI